MSIHTADDDVVVISNDYLEQSLTVEVNRTQELRDIINGELLQFNSILDDYDAASVVVVVKRDHSSRILDSKLSIATASNVTDNVGSGKFDDARSDEFNSMNDSQGVYNERSDMYRNRTSATLSPMRNKHEQHKPLNQKSMNIVAFPQSLSNYMGGTHDFNKNSVISNNTTTPDNLPSYLSHYDLIQLHYRST